jgi:ABC-type nitrate/sulfonate/bicarbonate transport system substrate-binding protein
MFVAFEEGFFEAEGLDVKPVSFIQGSDALNSLAKGDIAAHGISTYTDLFNIEARTPGTFNILLIQEISESFSNEAIVVTQDSEITDVSQLSGRAIGVYPGSFTEAAIKKAYAEEIDFTETQIVKLPPQAQLDALTQGQIDALFAYEPTITIGTKDEKISILDDHPLGKVREPFPVGGYVLSTQFMEENPKVAQKIVNGLKNAYLHGRENPDVVERSIAKFTNLDENIASSLRQNKTIPVSELSENYFEETVKLYMDLGLIDQELDVSNIQYVQE